MKKHYRLKKSVKYCAIGFIIGVLATTIVFKAIPVNSVEATATETIVETTKDNEPISLGNFKITAYCSCDKCCGEWADGITYTGTVARPNHTIAVDPRVIPLGSKVEINGVTYTAEDIGGSIKENRIDVFFNNHTDALKYGVKYHEVFLVEEV